MDFGERLVQARESLGFNQSDFADELVLAAQSLARYEKNKVKPSIEFLTKLTYMFNINSNWLLTGKGSICIEDQENGNLPIALEKHPEDDENTVALNYYPDIVAAAGYGAINESNIHPQIMKFDRRFLEEFLNVRRFDSIDIIKVIGDSMEPYIHDGEIVLVERHSDARNGETVIASVNGHIYVKRYHADPFGKWVKLVSENNIYGSLELEGDQLEYFSIIGIVRAKIKAF